MRYTPSADLKKSHGKESGLPDGEITWGPWTTFGVGFAAYLAPQLIVGSFVAVYAAINNKDIDSLLGEAPNVWLNFLVSLAISLVGAWMIFEFIRRRNVSFQKIGIRKTKIEDVLLSIPGYVVYFLCLVVAFQVITTLLPGLDLDEEQVTGFEPGGTPETILAFFALVIVAPLFEEFLFRGFIFQSLAKRWGFWAASLSASALFALAHGQMNVAIDTFILGTIAAWLVWHTKSLWPAIMLHGIKNMVAFVILYVIK